MIIYDVDTQNDFIREDGALAVEGAEAIIPNIQKIMDQAYEDCILVVGSVDAHDEDDPEFEHFPPHCVKGTEGQKKIPESLYSDRYVYTIPNDGSGVSIDTLKLTDQVYLEKQTYNIWDKSLGQPQNLNTILMHNHVKDIYIVGVASNICVLAAIEGFVSHEEEYRIHVITDAIKGLHISDDDNEETALNRMKELGVELLTTEEFITMCNTWEDI